METTKAQKKKVGRPAGTPNLLTPETQQAICAALEIAVPIKYAVVAAGISEQLYRQWMDKGEAGTEPYAAFYCSVTRARAKAVADLQRLAIDGKTGAMWTLERRFRDDYGPVQKVQLGGDPGGVPIGIKGEMDKLSAEDLRKLANDSTGD